MTQTREKWYFFFLIELTFEWYESAMLWETLFREMDQHTCNSIVGEHTGKTYDEQNSFLVKPHETTVDEDAWKIISCIKIYASTLKNISPKWKVNISFIIVFFFSQTNLLLKYNLMLIRTFSSTIYLPLFYFDILCILKFVQYFYALFIRTSKVLMRLNILFLEVYSCNMFLLCSYFLWNISTC